MKCKGCGADICWIRMQYSGKSMPVNAEPISVMYGAGTDTFVREDGLTIIGKKIGEDFDYDAYPDGQVMEAYESHFATCPNAGKFRKGGGN